MSRYPFTNELQHFGSNGFLRVGGLIEGTGFADPKPAVQIWK
jgi:hypothetical protein